MSVVARPGRTDSQASSRTLQSLAMIAAIVAATIGVTLFLMQLAGCFYPKVAAAEGKSSQSDLARTTLGDVCLIYKPRHESAVGTIKAVHEAAVASRLLARVIEVNVKAGQAVQRDDVLVRLDDNDLQARHKQVEATWESAKANLGNAVLDFDRARQLLPRASISPAEYYRASTTVRTTEA